MRGLLRDFADKGGTVLLSSHLLMEVDVIADQLVVIGDGAILAQGARQELLAGGGVRVKALDREALLRALQRAGIESTPTLDGADIAQATAEAVGRVADAGLEQFFLGLTGS
jgi:ABC-2 type transport system ATP-binding protein